jgi:hypothetical protein
MESWTGHSVVTVVFTSTRFSSPEFRATLCLYRVSDKRFLVCKASAVVIPYAYDSCTTALARRSTNTTQLRRLDNGSFVVMLLLLTFLVLKIDLCRRPMHACKQRTIRIWNAAYMSQNAWSRPRVGAAAYVGIRFLNWPAIGSLVNAKATLHFAIRVKRYWCVRSSINSEITVMQEVHEDHMILQTRTR